MTSLFLLVRLVPLLRRRVVVAAAAALLGAAPPVLAGVAPAVEWELLSGSGSGRSDVRALAWRDADGRLAAGDGSGVRVGAPGGPFERVLRRGPVRDLRFDQDGALWVATGRGLYRCGASFRELASVTLAPGAEARDVRRIAVIPGAVAAATVGGAFVRIGDAAWRRVSAGLPSGPASAPALRRIGDVVELWVAVSGALWRVPFPPVSTAATAPGPSASGAERVTIAFAASVGGPVDVAFDLPGAEVVVLYERGLALLRPGASSPSASSPGASGPGSSSPSASGWETLRPVLPPGAKANRIGVGLGRLWLATDRGLLEAPAIEGPWRRTRAPLGSAEVRALVRGGRAVHVAADIGLRTGRVAASVRRAARTASEFPDDPGIHVVHMAALAYLRLQPSRLDAMRRGVRERGWLPVVGVRFAGGRDEARTTERDESFISGATRRLTDRDHDRGRDVEVSLSFSWDLGDVAYHPEQIDVSREAREVIELRDDVLDEVTQLYFERRQLLAELARADPGTDATRLRLRAAELAAGIDAWTGGWFTRNAAPVVH